MRRKIDLNIHKRQTKKPTSKTGRTYKMNLNVLAKEIEDTILSIERKFVNCVVRFPAHCIERLTGFNNFDLASALFWLFNASLLIGLYVSAQHHLSLLNQSLDKMNIEGLEIGLRFAWVPCALGLYYFISSYIAEMYRSRRYLFAQGRLNEVSTRASNRDRAAVGLLTILAMSAFYHYNELGVRVVLVTAPVLYIMLGLAKTEPYFNLEEQSMRLKSLRRTLYVITVPFYLIFIGICARKLLGQWVYYVAIVNLILMALLGLKVLVLGNTVNKMENGDRNRRF